MKKLLIIIHLIPLFGISQTNTTYNTVGEIISLNQQGIDGLVKKYKTILKNTGGVEGWKIQVTFKAKREDILPHQIKFTTLYTDIPAQITFNSPYYKLTAGNFKTRNKALKITHQIRKNFPGAHPVPIVIDPNLLKD